MDITVLATRLAARLVPPCALDVRGYDRADYRARLLERAWLAGRRCDELHPGADFRARWQFSAMWREYRAQRRAQRERKPVPDLQSLCLASVPSPHARVAARDFLDKMAASLSPPDWAVLARVGLAGGSPAVAYDEKQDGRPEAFRKRVQRLRSRVRGMQWQS